MNLCFARYVILALLCAITLSLSAQRWRTEYRDQYVYCFVNNNRSAYWTNGPKLPNHKLEVKNISNTKVTVRCLIKVVLRNDEKIFETKTADVKTTVLPGHTGYLTSWMSTSGKRNAYYCVVAFDVVSVTPAGGGVYGGDGSGYGSYNGPRPSKEYFKIETVYRKTTSTDDTTVTFYPNGTCTSVGYINEDGMSVKGSSVGTYYIEGYKIYVLWDNWYKETYTIKKR